MTETLMSADRFSPKRLAEALTLAAAGYKPVAGGSDLIIRRHAVTAAHNRGLQPFQGHMPQLFYTGRIEELKSISISPDRITIGAGASLASVAACSDIPEILRDAVRSIASPGIRNSATLAGNICNASPAGDSLPPLYILSALIETAVLGEDGKTETGAIAIEDFIVAPGKTLLKPGEIVTSIIIPAGNRSGCFRKVGTRAANALSKLSIAADWQISSSRVDGFRLAVGACGPTVFRSEEAESLICGCRLSGLDNITGEVLEVYRRGLKPIDDQRSTARYRLNTALRIIAGILGELGEK